MEILAENNNYEYKEGYTTCPDCGEKINFENDGGNGFCINCGKNH